MMKRPTIRFNGFTDDWEQRKLEDVMSCITDYVAAGSFADIRENVTYLNENGYAQLVRTVDLKKRFTNDDLVFVDENAFNYLWRVNLNEECIVLPNIGANIGEVYYVEPSELPRERNVLGPNAILLKTNEDKYFVFTLLNSDFFQKQLFENVGSSGQPKFNKTELKCIPLFMPKIDEQEKNGSYFRNIDNLITLHQRKCEETKKLKKFMLQNMFPQNGEKTPKIRFAGFTDDWEQRKLGETCQITMGQSPDGATYSETPTDYILVQGNADLKDGWVFPRVWTTQKTKTADVGDLIMSVRAPAGAMGKTAYNVVLGRGVAGIKGNEFIYQTLVKMNFDGYWKKLAAGCTFESINSEVVNKAEILIPDVEEQQKIGDYFRYLDILITLHQRKCDELQNMKKFMLQNMFV